MVTSVTDLCCGISSAAGRPPSYPMACRIRENNRGITVDNTCLNMQHAHYRRVIPYFVSFFFFFFKGEVLNGAQSL